jgi:hypothetical protein
MDSQKLISIVDRQTRQPGCKYCGAPDGYIITKSGQDCVYCASCNKHQYNAPKTETGREARSVSTTHAAIKPKQRSRIIERANGRCERCGKPAAVSVTGLHVGHIVSVVDGHKHGLTDDTINSDENLLAECDECNLGHGKAALPMRLLIALLLTRTQSSDSN